MHRFFRCPCFAAAALVALAFAGGTPAAFAQQDNSTPNSASAPVDATPNASAQTDATTTAKPADRLAVRLHLGDGRRLWEPSRRQIGVSYAPGGSDQSKPGQFRFIVDRVKLRRYLTATAPYIKRRPKNAIPVIVESDPSSDMGEGQAPAKINPGYSGAVLDVDAAMNTIQKAIQGDPATQHIVLPIKTQPAAVSAAKLAGINARIGYFVTRFNPGEVGRTQTVRRAIQIIDGHTVPPGGVFSINSVVGERTAERGFGIGHVFIEGKMEKQLGGGMCQVATTLFNAAMLADLKIVERHQHVRTVPYVEPGRDATVYWGQKDFKFQNSTKAPLYISYKATRNHAIVSLFGKATPGLKVKLVSQHRRLGPRQYTGLFYRVVYNADGTVQKDKPFRSAYKWTPALDFSH